MNMFRFWKRDSLPADEQESIRKRGWNDCLDAVERFLAEHSWVVEDGEIFCDGCGARLAHQVQEMRK